jgi:NADPH:quinone reductase-like Zn-dependent oxidoreductase
MLAWKPFAREDVALLTDLLEKRAIRPFIDRTYSFEEIPAALRYQAEGTATGKIVVRI